MIPNPMQLQNAIKPLMEKFLSDLRSHGYFKEGIEVSISSYADRLTDGLSRQNTQLIKTILSEIIPAGYFNDKDSAPSLYLEFLSITIKNSTPENMSNMSVSLMAELKTLKTKYEIALKKPHKVPDLFTANEARAEEFADQASYTSKLLLVMSLGIAVAGGLVFLAKHRRHNLDVKASVTQIEAGKEIIEHHAVCEEDEVIESLTTKDKGGVTCTRKVKVNGKDEIDIDDVYNDGAFMLEEKLSVEDKPDGLHVKKVQDSISQQGHSLTGKRIYVPKVNGSDANDAISQEELSKLMEFYGIDNQRTILYCYLGKKKNVDAVKAFGVYKELNMHSQVEFLADFRNRYQIEKNCFLCFDPVQKKYEKLYSIPAVKKWVEAGLAKERADLKEKIHDATAGKGASPEVDTCVQLVTDEAEKIVKSIDMMESDETDVNFGEGEIQNSDRLIEILSKIKKQPVILFLYLDGCPPCAAIKGKYMEISHRYRNNAKFYAICCNRGTELGEQARAFGIDKFPSMLILTKKSSDLNAKEWAKLFADTGFVKLTGSAECKTLEMHLGRLSQSKKAALQKTVKVQPKTVKAKKK